MTRAAMDLRIRHAIENEHNFDVREFLEASQAFGREARGIQFDAPRDRAPHIIDGFANGAAHSSYRSHYHVDV